MRRVLSASFGWLLFGSSSGAAAEGATIETVAVAVEDGGGCTSNDDFFRRIEARAPGVRRASSGEPARTFTARLSPGGEGRRSMIEVGQGALRLKSSTSPIEPTRS
jgi:hypothetical protein